VTRSQSWTLISFLALSVISGCVSARPGRVTTSREEESADYDRALPGSPQYRSLLIEIDWVAGYAPRKEAVDALEACAARWCRKPEGIEVALNEELPAQSVPRSGTDEALLRRLHQAYASCAPWDDAAYYLYILYAPRSAENKALAETFFWGSDRVSIVIYREAVDEEAILAVSAGEVERLVLLHEFGHVLGLAGRARGTEHCDDPRCVMWEGFDGRSAIANLAGILFRGRLPESFCAKCRSQLSGSLGGDGARR